MNWRLFEDVNFYFFNLFRVKMLFMKNYYKLIKKAIYNTIFLDKYIQESTNYIQKKLLYETRCLRLENSIYRSLDLGVSGKNNGDRELIVCY